MLKDKGFKVDSRITEKLAAAPSRRSSGPRAKSPSAQESTDDSHVELSKHISKIRSCGQEKDLQEAVRVFNNLKQSGVQMNSMIYNCLIDACVQCGDVRAALGYFEQMKQLNFVGTVSYNTMVKAYLSWNQVEQAQALLKEMSRRGLPPNKVTYNELLDARVTAKDRRGMWSVVDDMQASGVAPSPATCSILLKALTQHSLASDVSRTMGLLDMMRADGQVLFASVIEACIRIRQLEQL